MKEGSGKSRRLGLIFPEKLVFEEEHYRTTKANEVTTLMFQIIHKLTGKKNGTSQDFSNLSHKVIPMVQNSNHFIEDLKKLADLNNSKLLKSLSEVNSKDASPNTRYCTAQIIEQHRQDNKKQKKRGFRI